MGGAPSPLPYQSQTVVSDIPKWKKELLGFTPDAPEYSPFKALSRQGSAQARMIEGMTTAPSWSAMEQYYGAPKGTDLTPYIQATRRGTLTPEAPIPQRAAQGGLMSLAKRKGYADGGLTKQEQQWMSTKQKQGEAGKLTGANKTRWDALTAKKQAGQADEASSGAVPYSQAMETKVPFFDPEQMYGQYGGVTNPIYQQALDQLRGVSQAPSQFGQGTGIMSDAASRLMGAASYTPQSVDAPQIKRSDIRDVAAQQAQVERMRGAQNVRGALMSGPQSWTQPGVAQQYMDPYIQNVIDQETFEANRQAAQRQNQMRSQAVQQKAFGGTRAALQQAEDNRNLGYLLADIENKGLSQAYGQGMQQFQQEQGLGQQAKQTNVGSLNQAALANQLYGRGGFQSQAANQAAQNLAYNNYVQQQLTAQLQNQGMDWNTASQNATMALQASMANQQAGLQANQQNIGALSGAGQLGQGIGALGGQMWNLQQNIPQMWGQAGQTVQGIAQNWQNARQQTAQNLYGGMNQAYQPVVNMLTGTPGSTSVGNVSRVPGVTP